MRRGEGCRGGGGGGAPEPSRSLGPASFMRSGLTCGGSGGSVKKDKDGAVVISGGEGGLV